MSALFLIVHIVHKKDLIYHSMTPALHYDNSRRKIISQNVNLELQNPKMTTYMHTHLHASMHLRHVGTPNFISLQSNRQFIYFYKWQQLL